MNPDASTQQLLDADALARRWLIPKAAVYRLSREGKLPTVALGRYRRFRLTDVEAFEAGGGTNGNAHDEGADAMTETTITIPIKAELRASNVFTRWPCVLCGGATEKVRVNAELIEPDKGFVCEECLRAGPEDAMRRGFDFAFRLEASDGRGAEEKGRALRAALDRGLELPDYAEWRKHNESPEPAP